ncbi:uncharacterized protein LOC123206859 isoform X2 [Mangifera indica]|uniref:uncharacterized protein LOC123206859 isoform X2 n=1 Tax=Mangifera indica TaxID=29780 RepID=UPI001CFB1529|nr:uncharacterized protein LOC123206859 isoform X2 [Mangifera indica]
MSSTVIEPTNQQKHDLLIGENYNLTLARSMQDLVAETQKGTSNFSPFINVFYRLMQAKIDPPLESIWVYTILTVRSRNFTNDEPLNRLSVTKEMFELISVCSSACSSLKGIALLAPVVFELHKVVVESKRRDLSSKREKKLIREIRSLVNVILEFISVCCSQNLVEQSDNLIVPFKILASLWMSENQSLESILPLVSAEISREVSEGVCDVNHLAGVVIFEMFLLKLCLSFGMGIAGAQSEEDLKSWVVGSITGFQNAYFFETLVRMLLEPTLPVTSLLSSEDEVLLRKVLYDAIILVEYCFLNPERAVHLPTEQMKRLAMARLIVTQEAIESLRENGDQKRAISYASAFSSSKLPAQIIKWITSQIGMDEKPSRSFGSSPKTLLEWLLGLDNQGIRVFDDRTLKTRAKLVVDNSKHDYKPQPSKMERKHADSDILFYIDNKGEVEDGDEEQKKLNKSMSAAFVAAAHSMKMTKNGVTKRKEKGITGKMKKIKYLKFDLSENFGSTIERNSSVSNESLNSGSEVDEPSSDEDMETDEQ